MVDMAAPNWQPAIGGILALVLLLTFCIYIWIIAPYPMRRKAADWFLVSVGCLLVASLLHAGLS